MHFRDDRPWLELFFQGRRLEAEVVLHAQRLQCHGLQRSSDPGAVNGTDPSDLSALQLLQRAYGRELPKPEAPMPILQAAYQAAGDSPRALRALITQEPGYPDPLLLLALRTLLPAAADHGLRRQLLQRVGLLLMRQFPQRHDLLLALLMAEGASEVLKSLPQRSMPASAYYGNGQVALMELQSQWSKGNYANLLLTYIHYQLSQRWFPKSDYVLRCYTIIGAIDRVDALFRAIYQRYAAELVPVTLSNMLFTALGLEQLDQIYVNQLVEHWRRLTRTPCQVAESPAPRPLQALERPTLVVCSADLRMHPVGRFWLPLAQRLSGQFRLVHVGFNPHEHDSVRDQLRACSDGWHLLESTATAETEALLRNLQPDLLLDLGGHTADNRPGLLNQRFAAVQATYLGFYGPSYGEQCDWWVLDQAIARRVRDSYPGSEPIWELPGPSLCYDPSSHGLPPVQQIAYSEPDHPVIGSFNHTRKLTTACIERFAQLLRSMPQAVLQFRSHSFYDPAVRRWFVMRFLDAGVAAHQLQPLPYAPSGKDALLDYGRIHLHLDSYPVSGTTTTLDSLAMGIPVLTCPNHLYAGAISAALLEHAGLAEMVCEHPDQLAHRAKNLCERYASAEARRQLAQRVRTSPLCDPQALPAMFAEQLGEMLRRAR
ncbi:hypothetical protein KBY58_04260 [Cyanobium sp. HWJ4-Hawea]|uniref:O-linked N-acetylglucosamine transferase family protein n=1 Tax=Cyanobium sp. HWJ4-Hawea TaxID=2823713 RepID=UPI0020CBDA72|nr:hypothetical protein [Cyanobium sp. HWJ4-Hawea]MCP9808645.1 hypothetical protein [Cyanobium sp. HWJ4-Hawea]